MNIQQWTYGQITAMQDHLIDKYCRQQVLQPTEWRRYQKMCRSVISKHNALCKQKIVHLAFAYFSCAILLDIAGDESARLDYQKAHKLKPNDSLICICYANFLFQRKEKQAIFMISILKKIQIIENAILPQNHFNILEIIRRKFIYSFKNQIIRMRIHGSLFQKQVIQVVSEFTVQMAQTLFGRQQITPISYVALITALIRLDRLEKAHFWLEVFVNQKYQKPIDPSLIGSLYYQLGMKDEAIPYFQQAVIEQPQQDRIREFLINLLYQVGKYKQAKQYCKQPVSFSKNKSMRYQFLGKQYFFERKYVRCIYYLLKSLRYNDQNSMVYYYLGMSFEKLDRWTQAVKFLVLSLHIKPQDHVYSLLGYIFSKQNQQLSGIYCHKRAIQLNFKSILSYISLTQIGQKYEHLKSSINSFMENLVAQNSSNRILKLNFAIYDFIANNRQSNLLNQIALGQSKMQNYQKDQELQLPINYIISSFNLLFQQNIKINGLFALVVGVLSRIKGNKDQSIRCFLTLYQNIRDDSRNHTILRNIYNKYLKKVPKEVLAKFLEFIILQISQISTKQALLYYLDAKNICQISSDNFRKQFERQLGRRAQEGIQLLLNINNYQQVNNNLKDPKEKAFFKSLGEDFVIKEYKKVIKLGKYFSRLSQNKPIEEQNIIIRRLKGRNWNKKISEKDPYFSLYSQINHQEKQAASQIKRYFKIFETSQRQQILRQLIQVYLEFYFYQNFCVNQMIKNVLQVFPLWLIILNNSEQSFAFILEHFKSNSNDFQKLKENLKILFVLKKQDKNDSEQDLKQPNETSFFSIDEFDNQYQQNLVVRGRIQGKNKADSLVDNRQEIIFESNPNYSSNKKERKFSLPLDLVKEDEKKQQFQEFFQTYQEDKQIKRILHQFRKEEEEDEEEEEEEEEEGQQSSDQQSIFYQLSSKVQNSSKQLNERNYPKIKEIHYLKYPLQNTNFKQNYKQYQKFNSLFFQTNFWIIKHIENHPLDNVAIHQIPIKSIDGTTKNFQVHVQFGDPMVRQGINYGNIEVINWLWKKGLQCVLKWIIDIAMGVFQLQDQGIYHIDLQLRNTIAVGVGENIHFKIVDFDYAVKPIASSNNDKAYQFTLQLMDFWLNSRVYSRDSKGPKMKVKTTNHSDFLLSQSSLFEKLYDQADVIKYVFRGADQSLIDKLISIKNERVFSLQRLSQCLKELRNHMKKSHLKQYTNLVRQLLNGNPDKKLAILNLYQKQVEAILKILQQDCDYQRFANEVKRLLNEYHNNQ